MASPSYPPVPNGSNNSRVVIAGVGWRYLSKSLKVSGPVLVKFVLKWNLTPPPLQLDMGEYLS